MNSAYPMQVSRADGASAEREAAASGISFDEIVRLAVEACPSGMIMTDTGGQIGHEPVPGGGTVFYVCLPSADWSHASPSTTPQLPLSRPASF